MTGTIAQLQRDRGTGVVLADDGKTYLFRRTSLKNVWFHDLKDGMVVTFEPGKDLSANHVCLVRRTGTT